MISLFLLIIAAAADSTKETLQFHFGKSIFSKHPNLDPFHSWRNKYKNKAYDGKYMPNFWGSTTIFVALTDFFHSCKSIWLLMMFLSIIFYTPMINWWADFLILRVAYGLVFELFFRWVLIRRIK